mgnify:CR=1 FL=1|jgi:hypothetical protein
MKWSRQLQQAALFSLMTLLVSPVLLAQEKSDSPAQEAAEKDNGAEKAEKKDSEDDKTAVLPPFVVTISGDIDAASAPVIGRLTGLFYESYPKLVKRFSNPDRPAPTHIKLVFKQTLHVPAYCSGSEITINLDWLRKNPEDIGLLTHELTHAVQGYGRGVPGWFTEGFADFTRKVYGPEVQPGWELPKRLTSRNKYTDSYRVTGRFLLWLDEKHPGVVDQLHRKAQKREFDVALFKELTGQTIDELWDACVKDLSGAR